jgi:Family of unknown function (DUF6879)
LLFTSFEHTAFRLEVRRTYNPSYEDETLGNFLAGKPLDLSWMQEWLRMVQDAGAEGRLFARVRVVDLPMSDWNRYSYALAQHNIAAGEDIRYLARDQAAGLPDHDYWLFDSSKLVVMRFDAADRFTGGELVEDPTEIVKANYWRDAAWHKAVRRDDFEGEPPGKRA